jgi:hypothetical protein
MNGARDRSDCSETQGMLHQTRSGSRQCEPRYSKKWSIGQDGARGRSRTGTGDKSRGIFLPSTAFTAAYLKRFWGLDFPFTIS